MAQLNAQQTSLEASAAAMLQAAHERLSSATALSEGELSALKQKAAAAAEEQAISDATGRKQQLLKEAVQKVDQEVGQGDSSEVCSSIVTWPGQCLVAAAGQL